MKTLILGGVRSGKSRLAEEIAEGTGLPVTVIATATAADEEMRLRIAAHRARRPPHWTLVEEPQLLAARLREHAAHGHCVIVDCITLWLTNLLLAPEESLFARETGALLERLSDIPGDIIFVSNETNLGVIPMAALARRFCDEAGNFHQELARRCARVLFTIAGLAVVLKGRPL